MRAPAALAIGPTSGHEREPALDVVRGFALLGILSVNVLLMRGSDVWMVLGSAGLIRPDCFDRVDEPD